MSTIKIISTVPSHYLLSLPGNIKLWGGQVKEVPASLMENPGFQKYLKSGRVKIVVEPDARIPVEDQKKIEALKEEALKVEVTDEVIEEGPDAVLVGAINEDGSFVPKEEVELTEEKPKKKKKKGSDEDASQE